jgi:hypothetical protein
MIKNLIGWDLKPRQNQ